MNLDAARNPYIQPYAVESQLFRAHLMRHIGKPIQIIIKVFKKTRSNLQNRYYWGHLMSEIAEHCGYEHPEDAHEICKERFLRESSRPGRPGKIRSTTDLSTVEAEQYYEKIRRWAAQGFPEVGDFNNYPEYAITLLEPNQVNFI